MNIIVITGASSGMGRECALQVDKIYSLQCIDEIWIIARRKDRLTELSKQLRHKAYIFDYDLTSDNDLLKLKTEMELLSPNIKMFINCIGNGYYGDFSNLKLSDINSMISTNCKAMALVTSVCIPYMDKGSRIIQFASGAGFLPQSGFAIYAATKSFVISFSKALSKELSRREISVTTVCPGPVRTEFLDKATKNKKLPAFKKLFIQKPEDVVKKALFDAYMRKDISYSSLSMFFVHMISKYMPDKLLKKFI